MNISPHNDFWSMQNFFSALKIHHVETELLERHRESVSSVMEKATFSVNKLLLALLFFIFE